MSNSIEAFEHKFREQAWGLDIDRDTALEIWQAARAQGDAEPVNDFKAEIRTERDPCDEYVSFLVLVSGGKSHPYMFIPETLDQEVLDEALRRMNTRSPNAEIPNEHGKNRYGLDMAYFRRLFNRELNRPLTDFRPDELVRVLARAARTADADVLKETEFQGVASGAFTDPYVEIEALNERISQQQSDNEQLRARVAELEAREDAMCDLHYANGAKQGFSWGQVGDEESFAKCGDRRIPGSVAELKRLRQKADEAEMSGGEQ